MSSLNNPEDWPEYFHDKLKSEFVLSRTCVENCECYFLRHWSKEYFFQHPCSSAESIVYDGERYTVVFVGTLDGTQVALSFRKPLDLYDLPAYVLVKGIS